MGHLDSRRKHTQSSKKASLQPPDHEDTFLSPPQPPNQSHQCHLTTIAPNHVVYSDQTGRLPQASSTGNNYLLVAYDHKSNYIFLRPIMTRKADHLKDAIASVYDILTRTGFKPCFHQMDNNAPKS